MKISYRWLQDFIDLSAISIDDVSQMLTDIGLEVESVDKYEQIPGGLRGVLVAEVLETKPHPNADKLTLCSVSIGEQAEPLPIVCGAPNVAAGLKVALATVGTMLYPTGGEPFKIQKSKIRGEVSMGMLCAEDELGLGKGHEGIMVLDNSLTVGSPLADSLDIVEDWVFEIGLTPNRTDAMGHWGVAQDLAAALRLQVSARDYPAQYGSETCPLRVGVEDAVRCPRYAGVVIKGVQVADSPQWLQQRLRAIGAKPINNVVDVTNYVLFELGHPLHAFDLSAFGTSKLIVKPAENGQTFAALDGSEHSLTDQDLAITDGVQPLCLAGVMGGLHSGTTQTTTDIFLECASFQPDSVRKTSKRYQIFSESAYRFARGTSPEAVPFVLARATAMILEIAGGEATQPVDVYPHPDEAVSVTLHYDRLNKLAGTELPREEVEQILSLLNFQFIQKNRQYAVVQVPGTRRDVYRFEDVAEEVLRIYGLNKIPLPEKLNAAPTVPLPEASLYALKQRVADGLAAAGLFEIRTNSLVAERQVSKGGLDTQNPLSQDVAVLRTSLLPSALEVIAYNLNRKQADLRLFEFGKTYHQAAEKPEEQSWLGMWQVGAHQSAHWLQHRLPASAFTLGGELQRVFAWLGLSPQSQELASDSELAYGVAFFQGKHLVAKLGQVLPALCKSADVEQPVFMALVDWQWVANHWQQTKTTFQPLSKFPSVQRDLSMLVKPGMLFKDIAEMVAQVDPKRIQDVQLFDLYQPKDQEVRSYTIKIFIQDAAKTLEEVQLTMLMQRVIAKLTETGKIEIRA